MNNKEYADIVLKELTHTLTAIDQEAAKQFVSLIDQGDEIFLCRGRPQRFSSKRLCDAFNAYGHS